MSRLVLDNNFDRIMEHLIIIGGGDLLIAEFILKNYKNVKKITVCEIDERVIEVTKQYFSIQKIINEGFSSGRLEIKIESGAEYIHKLARQGLKNCVGGIVVDCTDFLLDPNSISAELYTPEFYSDIF
jgi:spermidine synthase